MLKKSKVLREIRKYLEEGNLLTIAWQKAGIKSPWTLHSWRKKYSRIDNYIVACLTRSDDKRVSAVEDKFYQRLLAGEASEAGYIFFLTNRIPERWKDRRAVVNNTNVVQNSVRNGAHYGEDLTTDELRGLRKDIRQKIAGAC